ncbi:hypothetical protein [Nocardia xishanensis]|uniref:hypothetical protein n=1 Tax=Nocardia xishanensis TaxID=238964 RepID=UPI00082F41FC|nr:hypothetical protein [Nocardia xishanensis]
MAEISTLEQLNEFTRSGALRATITGDLAAQINRTAGLSPAAPITITLDRKEHRDWNHASLGVTEVHWVTLGGARIDLGQILSRLGVAGLE